MPTPMWVYADAAEKFGKVDKTDDKAVDRFFVETFRTLSTRKQDAISSYLLKGEGKPALRPGTPANDDDYDVQIEIAVAEMTEFFHDVSLGDITIVKTMTEFHARGLRAYYLDEDYEAGIFVNRPSPTWEVGWLIAAILDHDNNVRKP